MVKRERHRYLLFKMLMMEKSGFSEQELLNSIWRSIWNLFGLKEANKIGLWLVKVDFERNIGIIYYNGVNFNKGNIWKKGNFVSP